MADNMVVMDNSINSRLLWPDSERPENNDYAWQVIEQAGRNVVFHVPNIWHYEMAQVAYKLTRLEKITQADARLYFNQISQLPIITDLESQTNTVAVTYGLSLYYKLSIYDGAYLETALRLGAPLATNDADLRKAAKKAGVPLYLV